MIKLISDFDNLQEDLLQSIAKEIGDAVYTEHKDDFADIVKRLVLAYKDQLTSPNDAELQLTIMAINGELNTLKVDLQKKLEPIILDRVGALFSLAGSALGAMASGFVINLLRGDYLKS